MLSTSARQPSHLCFGLQRPGLAFLDGYIRKIKVVKFRSPKLRQPSSGCRRLLVSGEFSSYAGFVGMSRISPFLLDVSGHAIWDH